MNSLLDHNDDDIEDHHRGRAGQKQDREITLGTTMILGIFFALAVFGSVMFGFGYSIGAKHTNSAIAAAQADPNATFNGFKPPSGKTATDLAKGGPAPASVTVPLTTPPVLPKAAARPTADPVTSAEAEVVPVAAPAALPARSLPPAPIVRPAAPAPVAAAPAGAIMVQIAAISPAHQEDADSVVTSLKRKGYAVAIRHESTDQLLHVQLGPFPTRKDAEAMRLRIQADGFNAIVKDPNH